MNKMLLDKSSKLPTNFFTPHEGDLKHSFVIGPTGLGMTMNPIATIGADPYHALYLLQLATQYELGVAREELAKTVALRVAAEKEPNVRDLVEAWKAEPSLVEFANAVAKTMLPN